MNRREYEQLMMLVVELGLATRQDIENSRAEATRRGMPSPWTVLRSQGKLTQSQYEILDNIRRAKVDFDRGCQDLKRAARESRSDAENPSRPSTQTSRDRISKLSDVPMHTPLPVRPHARRGSDGILARRSIPARDVIDPVADIPTEDPSGTRGGERTFVKKPSQQYSVPTTPQDNPANPTITPPPDVTPPAPSNLAAPPAAPQRPAPRPTASQASNHNTSQSDVNNDQVGVGELLGKQLGRYQIVKLIGQGASGAVFMAQHLYLNMPVAVKILDPPLAKKRPELIARFMHEGRSAARIRHQNVVRVHDCDFVNDFHLLVMEYLEGRTLHQIIRRNGPFPERKAHWLMLESARGLRAVHKAGLVHRDVKPDNILMTREREVKILDLGLSKWLNEAFDHTDTAPNAKLGTPAYRSPEQTYNAAEVDFRADVFSLGASFYHIVTGTIPSFGPKIHELIKGRPPVNMQHPEGIAWPTISEPVANLIDHMIRHHPDERPTSYEELLAEFDTVEDWFYNQPSEDRPEDEKPIRPDTNVDEVASETPTQAIKRSLFGGLFGGGG